MESVRSFEVNENPTTCWLLSVSVFWVSTTFCGVIAGPAAAVNSTGSRRRSVSPILAPSTENLSSQVCEMAPLNPRLFLNRLSNSLVMTVYVFGLDSLDPGPPFRAALAFTRDQTMSRSITGSWALRTAWPYFHSWNSRCTFRLQAAWLSVTVAFWAVGFH